MKTTERGRQCPLLGGGLLQALRSRKFVLAVAFAFLGAGLAFNWSWLIAIGIAPLLLVVAPCLAMCALGLCMGKDGGKSCAPAKADGESGDSRIR